MSWRHKSRTSKWQLYANDNRKQNKSLPGATGNQALAQNKTRDNDELRLKDKEKANYNCKTKCKTLSQNKGQENCNRETIGELQSQFKWHVNHNRGSNGKLQSQAKWQANYKPDQKANHNCGTNNKQNCLAKLLQDQWQVNYNRKKKDELHTMTRPMTSKLQLRIETKQWKEQDSRKALPPRAKLCKYILMAITRNWYTTRFPSQIT